ncbi:MAG: hypothetical protein AB7N76_23655 [Planctomycetota bacterium]
MERPELPKLPKGIKRIVVATPEGPETLCERKRKRKKTNRELRPLRRLARGVAQANRDAADEYLKRFDSSDRKKRNGWLENHLWNSLRAAREGHKRLRKIRVI